MTNKIQDFLQQSYDTERFKGFIKQAFDLKDFELQEDPPPRKRFKIQSFKLPSLSMKASSIALKITMEIQGSHLESILSKLIPSTQEKPSKMSSAILFDPLPFLRVSILQRTLLLSA